MNRRIDLNPNTPKICIPVVESENLKILQAMKSVKGSCADIVEWRMDHYSKIHDHIHVLELLQQIRSVLDDLPLLATFRTKQEGGQQEISFSNYRSLYTVLCESHCVDIIDLEYYFCQKDFSTLLSMAHAHDVSVICSYHNFTKTPSVHQMLNQLEQMKETNADIVKLAVMPQTTSDVWDLLEASSLFHEKYPQQPCITMSMAEKGVLSRLCPRYSGSMMTFGALEKTSAPGQVDAYKLKKVLDALEEL